MEWDKMTPQQRKKANRAAKKSALRKEQGTYTPPGERHIGSRKGDRPLKGVQQQPIKRSVGEIMENAKTLSMPEDVRLMNILTNQPRSVFEYLVSGEAAVSKHHKPRENRAIWYNELDKKHTFNPRYKQCRGNLALVSMAEENGKELPNLQLLYKRACAENSGDERDEDNPFSARELFLEAWQSSPDDIVQLCNRDIKRIGKCTQDLSAVLSAMHITGPKDAQQKGEEQTADQTTEMEIDDEFPKDETEWVGMTIAAMQKRVDELTKVDRPNHELVIKLLVRIMDVGKEEQLEQALDGFAL